MKENFIEPNDKHKNFSNLNTGERLSSNIQTVCEEEDQILNKIYSMGTMKSVMSTLLDKYTETENLTNEKDEDICKTMIVALKYDDPDESTIIKLVQFIANRFIDRREEFNDRACIISSVFFKKNNFDILNCKSIKKFEALLPKNLLENAKTPIKGIPKPTAFDSKLSYEDFKDHKFYYHENFNPMFLQRALKILKEDSQMNSIIAVHLNFETILARTSDRVFKNLSNELFHLLTEISNFNLLEYQFKSLAFLMKRDIKFYELGLKLFKETKSEVTKTYLIYTFDLLESLVDYDAKIHIHLSFADLFSSLEIELEPSTKEAALFFIQKGINLLKTLEK